MYGSILSLIFVSVNFLCVFDTDLVCMLSFNSEEVVKNVQLSPVFYLFIFFFFGK